jgi:hypothetical protein
VIETIEEGIETIEEAIETIEEAIETKEASEIGQIREKKINIKTRKNRPIDKTKIDLIQGKKKEKIGRLLRNSRLARTALDLTPEKEKRNTDKVHPIHLRAKEIKKGIIHNKNRNLRKDEEEILNNVC